jgi:hypothetical protein
MSDQPPDPIITSENQAEFWYNPNRGIFRARVMAQMTNEQTRQIYNQVNGTSLETVRMSSSESRRPVPLMVEYADAGGKQVSSTTRYEQWLKTSGVKKVGSEVVSDVQVVTEEQPAAAESYAKPTPRQEHKRVEPRPTLVNTPRYR